MSQTMTDVQRAMWNAWHDSEKALGTLIENKPKEPAMRGEGVDPILDEKLRQEWVAFRDASFDWQADWNAALGYRDAMHKACEIIKVPNFGNHG